MTTGTYTAIRYEVDGPVAVITLNRPERLNAIGGAMLAELRHAMATAERDTSVVGIVLTGRAAASARAPTWPASRIWPRRARTPS